MTYLAVKQINVDEMFSVANGYPANVKQAAFSN